MKLNTFFKECGEKGVVKMLSIYIVSSWVLIQVMAVVWEPLGVPQISVTYLILLLLIGLPIYLFYIWKYRLKPLEKKDTSTNKDGKRKQSQFQKMYFSSVLLVTILVAFAVTFIINSAFKSDIDLPELAASDKIGILMFGNNTGDAQFDVVSKMSADWIAHGITENKIAQVVSPEIVNDYISLIKAVEGKVDRESVLTNYFKPAKVITGNFYLNNNKLIFQSSITDGKINETLISFPPIECVKNNPLDCIEALKQQILGYLVTEGKSLIQDIPPKYEAYLHYLDAKANFTDNEKYLSLLNKAIAADESYFEPKVQRIAYYYNLGEYKTADSLYRSLELTSKINNRQRNLLEHYNALLKGDNRQIYSTTKKEYEKNQFDLQSNSTLMVVALQYVNKPEDLDGIFKKIDQSEIAYEDCIFCQYRMYSKALADVELKRYQQVIDSFGPMTELITDYYLKVPLIAAYVRSGDMVALDNYISGLKKLPDTTTWHRSMVFAIKELQLAGKTEVAENYLMQVEPEYSSIQSGSVRAKLLYYGKKYEALIKELKVNDISDNPELLSMLAVASQKTGRIDEVKKTLQLLNALDGPYMYGEIDYMLARYYARLGENEKALVQLNRAISKGYTYRPSFFQNDVDFKEIRNTPAFTEILNFWH